MSDQTDLDPVETVYVASIEAAVEQGDEARLRELVAGLAAYRRHFEAQQWRKP